MIRDRLSFSLSSSLLRLGRILVGLGGIALLTFLAPGSALAQDGNWAISNDGVGSFAGWAATSGVRTLVGDFNGDGRDDIALIRQTGGWSTMPVAFADGAGGWSITNRGNGAFAGWAATSGVQPLVGDFNGDGRDDVALVRLRSGWSTMPVAFANGSGGWNITNRGVGRFAGWAATSGVQPLVGDFNGDGRDDVALLRQVGGWQTMPVAFASPSGLGNWNVTNGGIGAFAGWAATSGVQPLVGDFNGNGRDDVALIRLRSGWSSMPVAFANGSGNWTITNGGAGAFAGWAATSGVQPLVGDFDGNGRDDVALVRLRSGWSSMPVAFANGSGNWNVTNRNVGPFAGWAATSGVQPLVGDFNGDGRTDVALIRSSGNWITMPVAFANGNGFWRVINGGSCIFSRWAATFGAQPLTGDFNGDGRDDVALVRRIGGWSTVPTALAATEPCAVRELTIRRHDTAALNNARADVILADASTVLQTDDGAGDIACTVTLARSGNVGVFNTGDGSLDTNAELTAVFDLPGNVKVVDEVNFCAGRFNVSFIGCGLTPGASFITERFTANQEGILWAHEFGHNQGLQHRDTSTNNVMFFSIGTNRRRVNQGECTAFIGPPALAGLTRVAGAEAVDTANLPVKDFVGQLYFHGLPLEKAAAYGNGDVAILLDMLEDAGAVRYHENVALTLGMIGNPHAVEPLIEYVQKGIGSAEASMSRRAFKGRVGAMVALGYLLHFTDSEEALSFLLESTSPEAWAERETVGLEADPKIPRELSKYAILSLGLSGNPAAAAYLEALRNRRLKLSPAEDSFLAEEEGVILQSLELNAEISSVGLIDYYSRENIEE